MKQTGWKCAPLVTCMLLAQPFFCFSQEKNEKLSVYLMEDKDLPLYKGIANQINISVREIAHPCDSVSIRIFIPNGEIEHLRKEAYNIIINTNPAIATIYADTPEGLVKAGTMTFRAAELPDTTNADFRAFVPHIQYHVDKNENFDPGTKIIPDRSTRYFLPTWRAPLGDLYSDVPKHLWIQVVKAREDGTACVLSPNLIVESTDAVITRVPGKRNTFAVSPKAGIKKCKLDVFMNQKGNKTLLFSSDLPVRKKPKDDY